MKSQCDKIVVIIYFLVVTFSVAASQRCNGGANCIPIKDCQGLYLQLQRDGSTPQLTKLLQNLHCGFQGIDVPKICCPPHFLYSNNEFRSNGPPAGTRALRESTSLLPDERICGINNNERIVGGVRTDLDEHPWMALLRYDTPSGWGFYCGGVLISSRYVLTAAHCVKSFPWTFKLSQVRLGEWDTSTTVDCIKDDCAPPVQDIEVEQIIAHAEYNVANINQYNDIALLRLSRNAQFNDFVKPICLPLTTELRQGTFEGYDMDVAGWGKTETRNESYVKLKVSVPVVQNWECDRVYERVKRKITNSQMCAGGLAGQDSCRGDSGGALMGLAPAANNWMVFGVVSYGPSPCGTPGWPGVYTRVGNYVDWILSNMLS